MPRSSGDFAQQSPFARPGPVVFALMCTLTGVWLAFVVGMHWAGVSAEAFELFVGDASAILHGQIWRILTAPLLTSPGTFWHLFPALLELYFFGAVLERDWRRGRFVGFLLSLAVLHAATQTIAAVLLPASVGQYLSAPLWFGPLAVTNGLVVAWALSNPSGVVRLYFFIPVPPKVIALLAVASPFGYLLFKEQPPEGVIGLLSGCLGGWLLGAGTPSPLRRAWLKFRLGRLDAEVARESAQRKKRVERSSLKVIEGGRGKTDGGDGGRGPDGRWLN